LPEQVPRSERPRSLSALSGSRADAASLPRVGPYYGGGMPGLDGDQIRKRLADAKLYLCTDARLPHGDLAEFVDAALAGGVDIVQLRDKTGGARSEEHTSELQSRENLVCRLLLEKKND